MPHPRPAKDPARLAAIARCLLMANAVLALITVTVELVYLDALAATTPMAYPYDARVGEVGQWLTLLYNAQLFGLLAGGGFFIAWLYRVYSNLRPLGAVELNHGEGWAIGGWFVPILALFRPLQLVNDAWRASDSRLGVVVPRAAWERAAVPAILLVWWIAFNLYMAITGIVGGMRPDYFTLETDRTTTMASMVGDGLAVVAALLAVRVVSVVTERQRARAEAREQMPPPPPAAWGPPLAAPVPASPWAAPGQQV